MEKTNHSNSENSSITCNNCQKKNPPNSLYCMNCGLKFANKEEKQSELENINFCPVCKKSFPKEVKFCLFDGNPVNSYSNDHSLEEKDIDQTNLIIKNKNQPEDKKNILYQFSGFEVSSDGLYSKLPLELLRSSTSILNPSPKIPNEVNLVNTSSYFSILAPKPKQTFGSYFSDIGITKKNLSSYFITFIFINSLFLLWMVDSISLESLLSSPSILTIIVAWSFIITLIFILPVIFTGKLVSRLQSEMIFKIEPTFLILSFAINIFVLQLDFPFPIVVFPGEMKFKTLPSRKEIGKAIHKGLVFSFLLLMFSSFVIAIGNLTLIEYFTKEILLSINLGFLIATLALSINLLPFGNMFGRVARVRPISYWTMTMLTFLVLMYAVSLISTT